jgi:TatD DNase family protein
MIDSHTHLDDPSFAADRTEVITRAFDSGVTHIVTIGCDLKTSLSAVELAGQDDRIYATVGIHPHESAGADAATLQELEELSRHPRVVAWGETGLDYHYMLAPREVQEEAFRRQIRLARDRNLPLVIHMREASEETIRILNEEDAGRIGGVLHCFTGNLPTAEKAMEMGFMISISGIVTFQNATALRDLVSRIPLEQLLIETDCPYLTPVPHRGKRNEPAYVRHVARQIAELRPLDSYDAIVGETAGNARRLFRIP